MQPPDTFVITGGCGFIGSHLAAELANRRPDAHLLIFDDVRSGTFANLTTAFRLAGVAPFAGSVSAQGVEDVHWRGLIEAIRPAAIFHLAAITDTTVDDEAEMLRINTEPSLEILDACVEGDTPLVYASSAATYGTPPHAARREAFAEDAAGDPSNIYGFSKWLVEAAHRRIDEQRSRQGLPPARVVGLRFFNVFGPGETAKGRMASMAHQIATAMVEGKPPRIFKMGEQARDQVPVGDVVDGCLAAAGVTREPGGSDRAVTPGIYNMGSGRATTFNELVDAIRDALAITEAERPTDYFEMPAHIARFYQDFTLADMTEAARGLGFQPSRDPLDEIAALARYIASEREQSAEAAV